MKNIHTIPLRANAHIVDALFCLMLETLWLSPYDRHRDHPLLGEFERNVRRMVVLLSTPEIDDSNRRETLIDLALVLETSLKRLVESEVFPEVNCIEATEALSEILVAVRRLCGCAAV